MSYDVMIFDPFNAAGDHSKVIVWYRGWSENKRYLDTQPTERRQLRTSSRDSWLEISKQFREMAKQ